MDLDQCDYWCLWRKLIGSWATCLCSCTHSMMVVAPCCSIADLMILLAPRVRQHHYSRRPSPPPLRRHLDQQSL